MNASSITLQSLGAPAPAALPSDNALRLGLLKIAASAAGGPVALDSGPVAYPVVFQGISYACPRLALYGYATERQLRNAITRELAKRERKAAASRARVS